MFVPSNVPAITYDQSNLKTTESSSKTVPPSAPGYIQQSSLENGNKIDLPWKSKPITNGFNSVPRTHRLNTKTDQTFKTNRRTSKERHNGIVSSKNPPRTQ